MLELHPPSSSKYCKIRMKHGNGNYWDMIAPLNNHFYFQYKGATKGIILNNGNVRASLHLEAPSGNLNTETAYIGTWNKGSYGTSYMCVAYKGREAGTGKYALLQENYGATFLNSSTALYLRINNYNIMYYNANGVYNSKNVRIHSDDRPKH